MNNEYYTPPDLDAMFPVAVEASKTPSSDPDAIKAKEEGIGIATKAINEELTKVRSGISSYVGGARQFDPNKTPFCLFLKKMSTTTSQEDAVQLIALARQDFGDKFANFVVSSFKPVYGDK